MEELIIEAQKGNAEAFTELILSIKIDLYKISKTRLIAEADIEDAIQESIIKAFSNIKKLKDINLFKSWIIKILINECNNIYRKQKIKSISFEEQEFENYISDNTQYFTDDDMDFYLLLKPLNYDERIAVILYYMEEYTTKEISNILKTNENTIKTRIARAKSKIKLELEEVV